MNILVACEESQRVCTAFRAKGHTAYSCDIEFCSGGHPEWHIWADVTPLLNGNCTFETFPQFKNSTGKYRQKNRSKTFEEVAAAMALSWG